MSARSVPPEPGGLSADSRRLSAFDGYDLAAARDVCAAIARYDKLFHLLQEYARHVGHLDIVRELIDGETGE